MGRAWAIGIFCGYGLIWGTLFVLIPLRSVDDWFRLFMWMTIPRALGFAALLWADSRYWRLATFRLKGMAWAQAAGYGLCVLLLWVLLMTRAEGAAWSWGQRLMGVSACLVVGLFEEYLFRGVVLAALLKRMSGIRAVLLSSVLFTVFHVRPQAIAAWPHIFLTGTVFANLRLRGMSLGQLALIHASVDAMFFFVGRHAAADYAPAYWLFLAGLYLYSVLTAPPPDAVKERVKPLL